MQRVHAPFAFIDYDLRLATWAVLSDSFMAGFFNGAPQVLISEMLGDMTCRDTIFEAETAEHCLHMLSHDAVGPKPQSLAKSTSSLLFDTWVGPTSPVYKRLTSSNLLAIICGMAKYITTNRRRIFALTSSSSWHHCRIGADQLPNPVVCERSPPCLLAMEGTMGHNNSERGGGPNCHARICQACPRTVVARGDSRESYGVW